MKPQGRGTPPTPKPRRRREAPAVPISFASPFIQIAIGSEVVLDVEISTPRGWPVAPPAFLSPRSRRRLRISIG